jgi:hypothetical protein
VQSFVGELSTWARWMNTGLSELVADPNIENEERQLGADLGEWFDKVGCFVTGGLSPVLCAYTRPGAKFVRVNKHLDV